MPLTPDDLDIIHSALQPGLNPHPEVVAQMARLQAELDHGAVSLEALALTTGILGSIPLRDLPAAFVAERDRAVARLRAEIERRKREA